MTKTLLELLHETAQGFHKAGVMSGQTMREFDAMCLPPVKKYSSNQIKKLRNRYHVSQAVFAKYLTTTTSPFRNGRLGRNVLAQLR